MPFFFREMAKEQPIVLGEKWYDPYGTDVINRNGSQAVRPTYSIELME
jgi:hypothetical protein